MCFFHSEKLAAITKHVFSSISRMLYPSGDIRKIVECLALLYRAETRPKKWKGQLFGEIIFFL
jgi:hypothetical protein